MDKVLSKLKVLIKKKGLTIYKLTEMSELSENTIYNWYNKGAEPSLHALYTICNILGISMAELFSETDDEMLTLRENELIKKYRKLTDEQKDIFIKLLNEFQD